MVEINSLVALLFRKTSMLLKTSLRRAYVRHGLRMPHDHRLRLHLRCVHGETILSTNFLRLFQDLFFPLLHTDYCSDVVESVSWDLEIGRLHMGGIFRRLDLVFEAEGRFSNSCLSNTALGRASHGSCSLWSFLRHRQVLNHCISLLFSLLLLLLFRFFPLRNFQLPLLLATSQITVDQILYLLGEFFIVLFNFIAWQLFGACHFSVSFLVKFLLVDLALRVTNCACIRLYVNIICDRQSMETAVITLAPRG